MRIAVLGTGIMGAPMARNLASAGHEVRAWNRTSSKAEGLGAQVASSPVEAVEGAEVIITMLADGPTVASVMDDVRLSDDVVWWQASTVGVDWVTKFAPHVDGPVMGTRQPAEEGKLTVLASGPGRERLGDVFDAVAAKVIDLGEEIGAGQRMKLVGNSWVLALVEGLAETIALAERLGVDPRDFLDDDRRRVDVRALRQDQGRGDDRSRVPAELPARARGQGRRADRRGRAGSAAAQADSAQMLKATEAGHGEEDMSATIRALWPEPS